MSDNKMPKLIIGDKVAEIPIIQGGMSVGISLSNLASAVANAGGIGVIGVAGIGYPEPDINKNLEEANERSLIRELRKARRMTNGLLGINVMMALSDYDKMINISVREGVDFVFVGAGLLLRMPDTLDMNVLKKSSTKFVPIISSAKGAGVMFKYWARFYDHVPDAVVVEGPKAGGHLGFTEEMIDDPEYALENLVPQVIETIKPYEEQFNKKIPVIAAGGIFTGDDIHKYLQMGASGVQMATRFVATYECDATQKFKDAYINSKEGDTIIIKSPVGMPGRAIRNQFLDDVSQGIKKPFQCPWKCLRTCEYKESPYCIALALCNAKEGSLENGFPFAGVNAHRVDRMMSVQELVDILVKEYGEAAGG